MKSASTGRHIESLTSFRRNSVELLRRLKRSKQPMVLTVNGRAEAVLQDAASYQRLLDLAAEASAEEGIRQGMDDLRHGRMTPAKEAFAALRRKYALPR